MRLREFVSPNRLILSIAALMLLALTACSDEEPVYVERPVEELYNEAMDMLEVQNYTGAVASFEEVDRQHPYSVWATKAQLMSAYVNYRADKYDEAIIALDRFVDLHPGNRDIGYAYYLRAISYYEQIVDVGRDQKITRLALDSLQDVVRRFPNSEYARDAQLKIDLARDHLAGKEMSVGRYYQRQGEYLAAINRFTATIRDYETTTHVPEALHRLVESYFALGIRPEAERTASVLGYNFPGSEWYSDSYALLEGKNLDEPEDNSWLSWTWSWIF
ncbi:MAG TPA: outer membrane protein assembly factor BamD [Rhodospirillaceae bacterium]|nr:outer membrane protein assembly factor BamD [Rhodospirillaceae bacterium]MAX64134.1 outer membrane protein assembly factor BamD [Rhodospirillaceae bacterium]MBB57393.1 outer membrane protein assembly factor BamD [Rhodospirillaceae bacterium]HAE01929.1 outer membrane protein assembly factor BamD [Rhodospirillaceae bacterium]HAJ19062.1 outer membrane protein assembly factor BamD [Rhodospirillaceae bacterium]|tara:strand:- start:83 stop:907 length:825 start_codon:yes stop_codon:yes gene_type:complete